MPSHPDRVRSAGLPEGYQFGDARPRFLKPFLAAVDRVEAILSLHWRPAHENAAEQLHRAATDRP